MAYTALSKKDFVNEIKEVSSGPHPRKFCFVLGAGASRTSGIKSGQELSEQEPDNEEYRKSLAVTQTAISAECE